MVTMSKKVTVLVVDDDTFNVRLMAEMCQNASYRVFEATDGVRALELARQELPELILLDAMMAGKNGFEVCRELRGDPRTSETATSNGRPNACSKASGAGVAWSSSSANRGMCFP